MGGKGGGANAFKNNKLTVGEKKNNLLLFAPPHDIWIFRRLCIYLVFYNTMYRPLIIQSYITFIFSFPTLKEEKKRKKYFSNFSTIIVLMY